MLLKSEFHEKETQVLRLFKVSIGERNHLNAADAFHLCSQLPDFAHPAVESAEDFPLHVLEQPASFDLWQHCLLHAVISAWLQHAFISDALEVVSLQAFVQVFPEPFSQHAFASAAEVLF
jgi:hypothetical protein